METFEGVQRIEVDVEAIPHFSLFLQAVAGVLMVTPAAENLTKLLQYICGRTKFSDGTTIQYVGGPVPLQAPLQQISVVLWLQIVLAVVFSDPFVEQVIRSVMWLLDGYVSFGLLVAVVPGLETSNGHRLRFAGTIEEYFKWHGLLLVSGLIPMLFGRFLPDGGFLYLIGMFFLWVITIVVCGAVTVNYFHWVASHVDGSTRKLRFDCPAMEMVGAAMASGLSTMLLFPIPWVLVWVLKWTSQKLVLQADPLLDGYSE